MSTDSNSGSSRASGRVRKKSVKLLDMQDLPAMVPTSSGNNCTNNGVRKSPAPAKLKIVIGGKEVVREVVPIKTSLLLNNSEEPKTLNPIKFRLSTSSVTHTLEESPSPVVVKKIKVEDVPAKPIQSTPASKIVVSPTIQPAKTGTTPVDVSPIKKEPMTPKLKASPATVTLKNSAKSKGAGKNVSTKNSAPKVIKEKRRHITAYTLWSRENRSIIQQDHPELDFAGVSKRMGEVWQHLSESEKYIWKMKAQKELAAVMSAAPPSHNVSKAALSKKPKKTPTKSGGKSKKSTKVSSSTSLLSPLRMAAHLKLIGESLETIGQQLTAESNEGKVSQNQLTSLLDCTLSSLGPLLALTRLHPHLDGCPQDVHLKILDDIAHILPNNIHL